MNYLKTVWETLKNSRHQKNDMKQVPYRRPINIRCHSSIAYGICAPLFYTNLILNCIMTNIGAETIPRRLEPLLKLYSCL
jgi:hypothetical protein